VATSWLSRKAKGEQIRNPEKVEDIWGGGADFMARVRSFGLGYGTCCPMRNGGNHIREKKGAIPGQEATVSYTRARRHKRQEETRNLGGLHGGGRVTSN